jgi:hypothetical protein
MKRDELARPILIASFTVSGAEARGTEGTMVPGIGIHQPRFARSTD